MTERPLIKMRIDELEQYANDHDNDYYQLEAVIVELDRRSLSYRARHQALRSRIIDRLAEFHGFQELLSYIFEADEFQAWFKQSGTRKPFFSEAVTIGQGPLAQHIFGDILRRYGCEPCAPESDLDVLIVGYKDWDEATLRRQVAIRSGKKLKVYSQEMAWAFTICGRDPFDSEEMLQFFGADHPALRFLARDGFAWPTTNVQPGYGYLAEIDAPSKGMLAHMGYHVGSNGKALTERRRILDKTYKEAHLPFVESDEYVAQWGEPYSSKRLKKIADSLATFTRNAKLGNRRHMNTAIRDWESDLEYLRNKYYPSHRFAWPSTDVP